MATQANVRIVGLEALRKKLRGEFLVQPEVSSALDTISERPLRAKKSLLGVKRNTVTVRSIGPLQREVMSTSVRTTGSPNPGSPRFNPRVTGRAWSGKNLNYMRSMSGNVIRKAIQRIEARWSS